MKDIKCITEKAKISLTHKAIEKIKKKKNLQHSLKVHLIKD